MDKKCGDNEKKSMIMGKAILKLSAYVNFGMLTVHILKARHLHSKENTNCQPFVQVCLSPDTSGGTKCCTAVTQSASPHSTFNEKFSFELLLPTDSKKRLHVSVWNTQATGSTSSEFLGAMSFGLNSLLSKNKDINGWYYLLKEDVGKKKHLPAVLRSAIYGEIGSPLQTPDCPETPLMEPKHTRIRQTTNNSTVVADVMVHRDFNGNATNKTEGDCLDCSSPPPVPGYFDQIRSHGSQVRSFHSSYRLGSKTRDSQIAHTQLTTVNYSPIASSKHVRFNTSESMRSSDVTAVPKTLLAPERSALKSPPMRRSQNPFVLQYRQEIALVENKVFLNSQKGQIGDDNDDNRVIQHGQEIVADDNVATPPDISRAEDLTGGKMTTTTNQENRAEDERKFESKVPVSVMGYPSQFKEECKKASSAVVPDFQKHPLAISCPSHGHTGNSREIWIDCQSLESNNTTQDSGICDSSSPKSEDQCCRRRGKAYQETSFCSVVAKRDGDTATTASVYKDSHLEPSVKSKTDLMNKYTEQFQVSPEKEKHCPISKVPDVTATKLNSSQNAARSKLSSASFSGGKKLLGSASAREISNKPSVDRCESCTVKYYRHLYSPVLGQRKMQTDKQEATHTKIYYL